MVVGVVANREAKLLDESLPVVGGVGRATLWSAEVPAPVDLSEDPDGCESAGVAFRGEGGTGN